MAGGCVTAPPVPRPVEKTPVKPAPPPTVNPHQAQIDALLQEAQQDFDRDQLTTPLNDNAYYHYLRVLSIDPDNANAKRGIADIAEKYLEWSMNAVNAGNFRLARDFLGSARSVAPDNPNIAAVNRLIEERRHASNMTYYLSIDGLNHKTRWVIDELKDIGRVSVKRKATAVITARSDAEGRWIYQQMNNGAPERVHARLEIGDRPRVQLIY